MSPHEPGGGWRYLSRQSGPGDAEGVLNRGAEPTGRPRCYELPQGRVRRVRAGQLASPALCSPLCRSWLQPGVAGCVTCGALGLFFHGVGVRRWQRVAARFLVAPDSHARGPVFESRCDHVKNQGLGAGRPHQEPGCVP